MLEVSKTITLLDLPPPPSVNRTRKINWRETKKIAAWHASADRMLLSVKYRPPMIERFELRITFSEELVNFDLDNGLKGLIDYLRRIDAIVDDSKKHLRRLVVEWGDAPEGCRVEIIVTT